MGIEDFKSYLFWKRFERLCCIDQWNTDDLDSFFDGFYEDFVEIHVPFRLKVDLHDAWTQYKGWVRGKVRMYAEEPEKYNYFREISAALQRSNFWTNCKDLALIFEGIFAYGYSNAFAEYLGHLGNVLMPAHKKQMGFILLDSYCQIKVNGPHVFQANPTISSALDFWYKAGLYSPLPHHRLTHLSHHRLTQSQPSLIDPSQPTLIDPISAIID